MAGALFSEAVISFFINTQDALGQLNSFQQKFSSSIGQMKNLLLGFVGFQGLRGAYSSLTKLVDVADKWHIPVEEVSSFSNLFATFGGNIDEATSAIETFQNMSKQLALHSSGPLKELSDRLGKNLFNKDYMAIIKDLREVYPRLTNNAKAEVQDLIGANAALRSMLESTDETWKANTARAKEMGTVSKENAESIRDMRIALAELKTTLITTAVPFLEALKPVLEIVRDLAMWFGALPAEVKKAFAWGTIASVAVVQIAKIVKAIGELNAALKTTTILSALASGGTTLIAGAAALGAAGLLYAGYKASQKPNSPIKQTDPLLNIKTSEGAVTAAEKIKQHNQDVRNRFTDTSVIPFFNAPKQQTEQKKNTNNTTNDNRVFNLTFNGIQNPDDFVNAFTSVAYNSTLPTRGWDNGN